MKNIIFLISILFLLGCKKQEMEVDLNYNIYDVDFSAEPFVFIDSITTHKSAEHYDDYGNAYYTISNHYHVRTTATSKNFKEFIIKRNDGLIFKGGNPFFSESSRIIIDLYNRPKNESYSGSSPYKPGAKHAYTLHLSEQYSVSIGSAPFEYTQPEI